MRRLWESNKATRKAKKRALLFLLGKGKWGLGVTDMAVCPVCKCENVDSETNYRKGDEYTTVVDCICNNCETTWEVVTEIRNIEKKEGDWK